MHTPILEALENYAGQGILRLHMPGHAGGRGLFPRAGDLAQIDLTEVPGVDDLHLPQDVILESRESLARCFGAEESFILVNGASSGIHALMLATVSDGATVLLPRNAHRSFYGALVLSGAEPEYIPCEINPSLGMAAAVRSDRITELLDLNPEARAVFVTSPSYFGTCSEIAKIAALVHEREIPLMVDEAHGAHFPFHPAYPETALHQGADAVVNGLHKTLPVFTQGAVLHIGKHFPALDSLRAAWSLLTTTSPSYLIMASIEWAVSFMSREGTAYLEQALDLSMEYQQKLKQIPGISCMNEDFMRQEGVQDIDPLKITLAIPEWNISGLELDEILRSRYGIQVEMAEENFILAMFSLLHKREDWERFYQAIKELAALYYQPGKKRRVAQQPGLPRKIMSPRQAFFAKRKTVLLREARGKIAGEMIAAYPPGIPCVLPGELIDAEIIDYLEYIRESGLRIQGPVDASLETIQIIE